MIVHVSLCVFASMVILLNLVTLIVCPVIFFIVSYNNAYGILRNLHTRCNVSFMFANAVVDRWSRYIRNNYV